MKERLGIEHLSVFGLPPVECVRLAADLGCRYISTILSPFSYNPHAYPTYSLRDDRSLRRDMIQAMADKGVQISLGEGFAVQAESDILAYDADLDVMAELGVPRINTMSFDSDLARTFDQFGLLAEMAASRGMETTVEFCPALPVSDLDTALAAVRHVGREDFRLLIDTMHFVRSGSSADDLSDLDSRYIGYIQLCDAPLQSQYSDYLEEAMYDRRVPGEGELPLANILAALPKDLIVGLEIPMRSAADAGIGPEDRVGRCVTAARRLLES